MLVAKALGGPDRRRLLAGLGALSEFCKAKVEDFRLSALGDENVGGLDVAVDYSRAERGVESVGNLDRRPKSWLEFERAFR